MATNSASLNCIPITAARSMTACSGSSRRSKRAASTAWMVGGVRTSAESAARLVRYGPAKTVITKVWNAELAKS